MKHCSCSCSCSLLVHLQTIHHPDKASNSTNSPTKSFHFQVDCHLQTDFISWCLIPQIESNFWISSTYCMDQLRFRLSSVAILFIPQLLLCDLKQSWTQPKGPMVVHQKAMVVLPSGWKPFKPSPSVRFFALPYLRLDQKRNEICHLTFIPFFTSR